MGNIDEEQKNDGQKKSKAQKVVNVIKLKCTDKVLMVTNIGAIVILILGAVLRTAWVFSEGKFNFFFLLTTVYFWIFIALLGFAEVSNT